MCIRDSDEAWNTTYGNKQRTTGGQIYFGTVLAVSYTHLDVYKRQT